MTLRFTNTIIILTWRPYFRSTLTQSERISLNSIVERVPDISTIPEHTPHHFLWDVYGRVVSNILRFLHPVFDTCNYRSM